jgi:AAA family ATPase
VRWGDIGGQHEIKKRLQKAVQRPLKVSHNCSKHTPGARSLSLLSSPTG